MARTRSMSKKKCVDLPEELVVEIMSWLPPDSLIRFKCVSKPWYALIKSLFVDPAFVLKHLHNMKNLSSSSSTSLAVRSQGPCTCDEDFPVLIHLPSCPHSVPLHLLTLFRDDADAENDHIHHVIEDLGIQHVPGEKFMGDEVDYHCNGVICFLRFRSDSDFNVFCNPTIKELRVLPEPLSLGENFRTCGGGLGYDSGDNDYKLVRLGYDTRFEKSRALVYSMNNDSWREIEIDSEINEDWNSDADLFCQGVLYWVVYNVGIQSYDQILSFDVSDELFHSLPLPDHSQLLKKESNLVRISLGEWNGSVALFCYHYEQHLPISIEIWARDNCFDGIKPKPSCSWIKLKLLTIGPILGFWDVSPLMFWKSDELLIWNYGGCVSYSLCNHKLRDLAIEDSNFRRCWASPYVKSLVSVQRRR